MRAASRAPLNKALDLTELVTGYPTMDIEGYAPEELLRLPDADLESLVFNGAPLVFRAGTAEILGQFELDGLRLIIELAQIDGGGEGVLPTLAALAQRYARHKGLAEIEWRVYATNCAQPNLKLRRVLERRGFVVRDVPGRGECYHQVVGVGESEV